MSARGAKAGAPTVLKHHPLCQRCQESELDSHFGTDFTRWDMNVGDRVWVVEKRATGAEMRFDVLSGSVIAAGPDNVAFAYDATGRTYFARRALVFRDPLDAERAAGRMRAEAATAGKMRATGDL